MGPPANREEDSTIEKRDIHIRLALLEHSLVDFKSEMSKRLDKYDETIEKNHDLLNTMLEYQAKQRGFWAAVTFISTAFGSILVAIFFPHLGSK